MEQNWPGCNRPSGHRARRARCGRSTSAATPFRSKRCRLGPHHSRADEPLPETPGPHTCRTNRAAAPGKIPCRRCSRASSRSAFHTAPAGVRTPLSLSPTSLPGKKRSAISRALSPSVLARARTDRQLGSRQTQEIGPTRASCCPSDIPRDRLPASGSPPELHWLDRSGAGDRDKLRTRPPFRRLVRACPLEMS